MMSITSANIRNDIRHYFRRGWRCLGGAHAGAAQELVQKGCCQRQWVCYIRSAAWEWFSTSNQSSRGCGHPLKSAPWGIWVASSLAA
eukprot:2414263-Pleurochrysis_carterae.AAC.3